MKDGNQTRMTLLNNWEATYFDFDEAKLVKLMDDAVELGVDMFCWMMVGLPTSIRAVVTIKD